MGIKGLLPKLITVTYPIDVNDLDHQTVGVDASTWIYAILSHHCLDILLDKADFKR